MPTAPKPKPKPKKKTTARKLPKRVREREAAREKKPESVESARASRVLSGRATRYLRGLGHHLEPIVQIGKEGITPGVVTATRAALLAHELVKVKISQDAPIPRKLAGQELADQVGASLAQTLGRTLLLYKRHPNKPKIDLPR